MAPPARSSTRSRGNRSGRPASISTTAPATASAAISRCTKGPARISKLGTVPLKRGMILSNEPGYYKTGAYGIRIENLVLVIEGPAVAGAEKPLNAFETLTLAPIDRRLVQRDLLTDGGSRVARCLSCARARDARAAGRCADQDLARRRDPTASLTASTHSTRTTSFSIRHAESGAFEIAQRVLQHRQGFDRKRGATEFARLRNPCGNQRRLRTALAVAFRRRGWRSDSRALRTRRAHRRPPGATPSNAMKWMKPSLPERPFVFAPHRVAERRAPLRGPAPRLPHDEIGPERRRLEESRIRSDSASIACAARNRPAEPAANRVHVRARAEPGEEPLTPARELLDSRASPSGRSPVSAPQRWTRFQLAEAC